MKIITIAEENHLHEVSTPIKNEDFRAEFKEIKQLLKESHGLGLALPQIGINKRAFVFKHGNSYEVVINPVIIKKSSKCSIRKEGCFSLPGQSFLVPRAKQIQVVYRTVDMQQRCLFLSDGNARTFQHEFDHLDGILIGDSAEYCHELKQSNIQ